MEIARMIEQWIIKVYGALQTCHFLRIHCETQAIALPNVRQDLVIWGQLLPWFPQLYICYNISGMLFISNNCLNLNLHGTISHYHSIRLHKVTGLFCRLFKVPPTASVGRSHCKDIKRIMCSLKGKLRTEQRQHKDISRTKKDKKRNNENKPRTRASRGQKRTYEGSHRGKVQFDQKSFNDMVK